MDVATVSEEPKVGPNTISLHGWNDGLIRAEHRHFIRVSKLSGRRGFLDTRDRRAPIV
jgi:hypothetical protein